MLPLMPPLWAVHLGDGQLTFAWCAGGFLVAGLLALIGAWRIREEEIPQLAVMTAAFFLTALIHVPIPAGPRTHLLLNGLLGVVLGRRAILAVLVGLFLQSSLSVMEGVGFSTLGVNACVLTLPALAAWGLFAGLHRLPWIRHPAVRAALVAFSTLLFVLSLCYAITALLSNYASLALVPDLTRANQVTFHPLMLLAALLLAALAAWLEHRLQHAAEFPLGLLIGELSVLLTILLNGLALLWGGTENWHKLVLLTFVIHLPLAVVEGIILGFTVGFLARVKPQLLSGYCPPPRTPSTAALSPTAVSKVLIFVLAPALLLLGAQPAWAHRLEADYRVLPRQRIQIESWFDITGDAPRGAKVRVYRSDESLFNEGELDARGVYVFHYDRPEALKIVVNAGMGHAKELQIPATALASLTGAQPESAAPEANPPPLVDHTSQFQMRDLVIAFAFIFGLAGFLLSLRHTRMLRELRRQLEQPKP